MENAFSLIDSHAHLSLFPEEELDTLLQRASEARVRTIINVCIDPLALQQGLLLKEKYPWIYCAAATTPHDAVKEGKKNLSFYAKAAQEKKLIAIGETGLDYHHHAASKENQKELFVQFLHMAHSHHLPLIVHCREAFNDLFSITKSHFPSNKVLLHCFTGTKEEAKKSLDRGWKISFSGILTFPHTKPLQEIAAYLPLDSLMIETDAPYLAPLPYRGKRNEPSYLLEIAKVLSLLRKTSLATIAHATQENGLSFFSLPPISYSLP